jgi:hypothetical protein
LGKTFILELSLSICLTWLFIVFQQQRIPSSFGFSVIIIPFNHGSYLRKYDNITFLTTTKQDNCLLIRWLLLFLKSMPGLAWSPIKNISPVGSLSMSYGFVEALAEAGYLTNPIKNSLIYIWKIQQRNKMKTGTSSCHLILTIKQITSERSNSRHRCSWIDTDQRKSSS